MSLDPEDKPTLRCLVSYPLTADVFSDTALVSVELAAELHARGYMVIGPDPEDEQAYVEWQRIQRWQSVKRKWFEQP